MVTERKFEVQHNGKTIRGIEYRPSGKGHPIAIVSHGFLANYKTTKHYAKQLAEWGYAAYCFDFIGGGLGCKSDGKLPEMTVFTEQADLCAVIDYAKALPYTNADDVTLMGCSQGGFVSALVAAKSGYKISKLVLFYPAFCIPDDARSGKMMFFKFDPQNIPDKLSFGPLRIGGEYARCVVDMDPYAEIVAYDAPVLLIHGDRDSIVDVSYAEKAKEVYGDRCTLQIIPKARHGFKKKTDLIAFDTLKKFLGV